MGRAQFAEHQGVLQLHVLSGECKRRARLLVFLSNVPPISGPSRRAVSSLGGDVGLNLRGNGPASFAHGEIISGEFFDTLGVGAAVGRMLSPSDDTPGAPPVVVLAYGYWQRAFGGDPSVAGKTILLNNIPVTIVGVAAKEFPGLDPARARQIWLPLSLSPQLGKDLYGTKGGDDPSLEAGDGIWWVYSVARLKQGISLGQAQAAADAVFHNDVLDKTKELFKVEDAPRLVLMPAPQGISGLREQFSTSLIILMTAVGMVLLVACANVAGLMLARSATRQRELAVRLALGAGRSRIARQLLGEECPESFSRIGACNRLWSLCPAEACGRRIWRCIWMCEFLCLRRQLPFSPGFYLDSRRRFAVCGWI